MPENCGVFPCPGYLSKEHASLYRKAFGDRKAEVVAQITGGEAEKKLYGVVLRVPVNVAEKLYQWT